MKTVINYKHHKNKKLNSSIDDYASLWIIKKKIIELIKKILSNIIH
jgi:hypothetical protein